MAFEGLSEKLQNVFSGLKGHGTLTEADIDKAMREVKLALLEADVNFKVVKKFVASIKEKSLGADVMKSLTPGQQVIKIVNEELTQLMGGTDSKITFSPSGFTVLMLVGLQGTGKTTTCGKLASWLKKKGKKPMLCACDVYRPAAVDQLEVVGKSVDVPVFTMRESSDPVQIAQAARKDAEKRGYNVLLIDTAGRLQIDETLMEELAAMKKAVSPHEILLVVDALTGQDAVNAAMGFNDKLGIDGIIMTKMDGDARGGAALSVREVTGKPIKFVGMGEKMDALEAFHPDRMASRILGMGDMMSLIEQAEAHYDEEEAARLEKKIRKNQFTLEDFLGLWTDRMDRIDGGESVRLYAQYVHTRQQDVLEQILLHNRDDICQLARLLQVIRKTDFHRAMSETGFPFNGGRISSVALRRDGMYIEAVQETAPVEYAAVDEHGVHCRFSKADGRCRIRGTLVETAGMRFFDTAPFGSLAETFDGEPDFHDGFVLVAAGEKVNYRALNRLARALTERIKNDGL